MIDPYAELKLTAQRMEADGASPDLVIDALLCVGLNAANRLHGPEFVIAHLHKLIEVFEEKARKQAPPAAPQRLAALPTLQPVAVAGNAG